MQLAESKKEKKNVPVFISELGDNTVMIMMRLTTRDVTAMYKHGRDVFEHTCG